MMGCAFAIPIAVSLALQATADLEVGIRVEGRASTLAPSGATAEASSTETRGAATTVPSASVVADGSSLRATASYAARIWTSDVEERASPLVNHTVNAGVETRHDRPWRVGAAATGTLGENDPLADPVQALAPGGASQAATAEPQPYEAVGASLFGERQLDLRTTLASRAEWNGSRGRTRAARELLRPQQTAVAETSITHRVTERDTLRVAATAAGAITDVADGETRSGSAAAFASWRRRLTPDVEGWLGGGAGLAYTDEPNLTPSRDLLPVAEAGLARNGGVRGVTLELSAKLTTFVDRFTGEVAPLMEGRCAATWPLSERLSLTGSGYGARRTDGETSLAAADVRVAWSIRPGLAVEAGVVGRLQRERRPDLPSFDEGGVVAALTWSSAREPSPRTPGYAAAPTRSGRDR